VPIPLDAPVTKARGRLSAVIIGAAPFRPKLLRSLLYGRVRGTRDVSIRAGLTALFSKALGQSAVELGDIVRDPSALCRVEHADGFVGIAAERPPQ
jgi:hypothetical protein